MNRSSRHSTGVPGLDELLGGGLMPGTLTVVVGATGIGKTQFGLQYANAGLSQEQRRGVVFDMSVRGDSQHQAEYARRMFDWTMESVDAGRQPMLSDFFDAPCHGDYVHVFERHGRKVARSDVDFYTWHRWQAELNSRLTATIAFLYGNLTCGVRRVVVDGIEPVDNPTESIQYELFEYIYQQVLRKDPQWVARDLFRQDYRAQAEAARQHSYDPSQVGCLLLATSREVMLDEMISRPLDEGDLLSGANTIILMGKTRDGNRLGRALVVAKHRGSACDEQIAPYAIDDHGLRLV